MSTETVVTLERDSGQTYTDTDGRLFIVSQGLSREDTLRIWLSTFNDLSKKGHIKVV